MSYVFDPISGIAFVTIFGLLFGLFLLLSGLFTAYFGSGKSRKIGVGLAVFGVVIGVLLGLYFWKLGGGGVTATFLPLVLDTVVVLIAAVLGALAAIGIFLVAIMKS